MGRRALRWLMMVMLFGVAGLVGSGVVQAQKPEELGFASVSREAVELPLSEDSGGRVLPLVGLLPDGNFEQGPPPGSAWTETLASCNPATRIGNWRTYWAGLGPFEGNYDFWVGGYCGPNPISNYVRQTIQVPSDARMLTFCFTSWRPDADDSYQEDYAYIRFGNTTIWQRPLTRSYNTFPNWAGAGVDISEFAGQTVTIRVGATAGSSGRMGNMRLDMFAFDGSGCGAPPSAGAVVLVHGWQGLNLRGGYDCREAVVPYTGQITEFEEVAAVAESEGYDVYMAYWKTGPFYTDRMDQAADCLRAQIANLLDDPEVDDDKVILVGHSMGGLVARYYIESGDYANDVESLITLGSPHTGINLLSVAFLLGVLRGNGQTVASLCLDDPGTCQLSSLYMSAYNAIRPVNGTMDYQLVGGTDAQLPLVWPFIYALEGPGDGLIGADSATGRIWPWGYEAVDGPRVYRWQTRESHNRLLSFFSRTPYYFEGTQTANCLRRFIPGGQAGSCSVATAPQAEPLRGGATIAALPVLTGTLAGGQSVTLPVTVAGTEGRFTLVWQTGAVAFTLRTPQGVVITPQTISQLPGASYSATGEAEGLLAASYSIPNVASGEWQATVTATDVPTTTAYGIFGAVKSNAQLTVDEQLTVPQGGTLPVTARFFNGATAITGATVNAIWYTPGGLQTTPLPMVAPGIYRASLPAPAQQGNYLLKVTAEQASQNLARETGLLVGVTAADVTQRGAATARGVDSNGNGRYEALRLEVPLTVNRAGDYVAKVVVSNDVGQVAAVYRQSFTLAVGAPTLRLDVSGADLRASGAAGPWRIQLELVNVATEQMIFSAPRLLENLPFSSGQFEAGGARRVYMPIVVTQLR